ncbi:MAG TPA: hypothetical protein VFE86_03155 [Ilumatobacteraceae bacterium]|nr:hypothetical protein [Ilumatobacteraceae bacterium]
MIDLEQSLEDLAGRVDIPGEQWMVDDVVRRIATVTPTRDRPRRVARVAALVVVAVVVLLLVLPGPRRAVARWLGFDSVRIEPGVTVPATTDSPLRLGPAVSMNAAMASTGLPDPTPAALGAPQSVHVIEPPQRGQILLVYTPSELVPQSDVTGVGALVSVMPAHIEAGFFRKTLGSDATVRPVEFDGVRGYWIEGSPHQLFFEIGQDQLEQDTLRLATNTLLWERNGHLYRLEADISLETAIGIASSIPPEV